MSTFMIRHPDRCIRLVYLIYVNCFASCRSVMIIVTSNNLGMFVNRKLD